VVISGVFPRFNPPKWGKKLAIVKKKKKKKEKKRKNEVMHMLIFG
jgi:hypothetical protein